MRDVAYVLEGLRLFARFAAPDIKAVNVALRALEPLLKEVGASYRHVGGAAVIHHGYERFTPDLHVLVSREARRGLRERGGPHGFVFQTSRRLRHEPTGVEVHLFVSGDPMPLAKDHMYPSPESAGASPRDAAYIGLRGLIELLLRARFRQGLADVTELLKKVDDRQYMALESEIAQDLRERLAELRQAALEELAFAPPENDDTERENHGP